MKPGRACIATRPTLREAEERPRIAVKGINHLRDEVMKVFRIA